MLILFHYFSFSLMSYTWSKIDQTCSAKTFAITVKNVSEKRSYFSLIGISLISWAGIFIFMQQVHFQMLFLMTIYKLKLIECLQEYIDYKSFEDFFSIPYIKGYLDQRWNRYRYEFQTGRSPSRPVIIDLLYLLFCSYYLINDM
jgi:hypothetical protein